MINASAPFSFLFGSYRNDNADYFSYTASYIEQIMPIANSTPLTFIVPMLSLTSGQVVFCLGASHMDIETDHTGELSGLYTHIQNFQSSKYITTNQSAICIYEGHGFSTIIPPVASYVSYYRFLPPSVTSFTHHAAIMVLTSH